MPGVQGGRKDRGDWRATCAAAAARKRERNIEERIAWAFSPISRGVFPKTENATRFASLPKELHPIAWAKFHEFAARAQRTGKLSKGWKARCYANAARVVKWKYIKKVNYAIRTQNIKFWRQRYRKLAAERSAQALALAKSRAQNKGKSKSSYSGLDGI